MRSSKQIQKAVIEMAHRIPHDKVTFADVAKLSGLHWTTVQRYFGNKEAMKTFILQNYENPSMADTRTKILNSANRVFAKHGYSRATLDLIAHEAGMTKGAVYWHFSSKSDLFLTLCELSLDHLQSRLPKQVQEVLTSDHPMESLRLLLVSEFESCKEDRGERTLLFFEFVSNIREPLVQEKLNAAFTKLILSTSIFLEEMQRKHLISEDSDPHELAITIHALINGAVLMWLISPEQVSFDSLAAEISKVLWNGIHSESYKD
ncbi:TetR family transcriptional regulator [Brevibacillus ruminantium]|uniref:TetR family transcriptional regulator n=1 Tax=Brevibacillus ruminantium TaxID=2950604 RepID=A0ABY4WB46_9BACL|nr:TetR family transcriptional regulator [Brevibacillus ruminantium]USG64407.1 TetR family transcriptional regulator [Brevibacillus ruminantium]